MYITKILNNSLVLAKDDNEKEIILMGKAIGHNHKIGYELNKEDIEKIFVLHDETIKMIHIHKILGELNENK